METGKVREVITALRPRRAHGKDRMSCKDIGKKSRDISSSKAI